MFRIIFIFLIFISACKQKSELQTTDLTKQIVKSDTNSKKISDSLKNIKSLPNQSDSGIYEGIFITNLNTKSFRDCKYPDSLYWVKDDTKKLEGQFNKLFGEQSVYNSVYLKVKGRIESTENIATGEKYPNTLRVKEILGMENKNFRNTCVPYDFWILGNEPNWSMSISKYEKLIELNLPNEKKSYFFNYNEPTEDKGILTYKSHNQIKGSIIEIRIKKEKCSDTMSDNVYEYSAEVELTGDRRFKGCAIKGIKN